MATNANFTAKQVNVPTSVDDSTKLQRLVDSAGNTPAEFVFSEKSEIEILSQVRFYNSCTLRGNGAVFRLRDKASTSVFPSMKSIIGAKSANPFNFNFFNLGFDGNYGKQSVQLGKGFHNFVGISNGANILIQGCKIYDSAGDGARLTNVKAVKFLDNEVRRCGHDAVYVDKGQDIEVGNNYVELRTNSGCRLRHVINGHAHDNYIVNKVSGKAACPGMQIENSTSGMKSSNIVIENNKILDTWGPGIWIIGTSNSSLSAASGLTVRNNLFSNCGNMDSDYHHLPGVGGIVATGWDNLDVSYNTFDRCRGYGVLLGSYYSSAAGSGYDAKIFRNIFTGTRKANTVGTASGAPVAKLDPKYTDVVVSENCFFDNVTAPYNVKPVSSIAKNPLYISPSDYHLQAVSPCRFANYQLGMYNGAETPEQPKTATYLMFDCSEDELATIKEQYKERTILRRS